MKVASVLCFMAVMAVSAAAAEVQFQIDSAGEDMRDRALVATSEGRRYRITDPAWGDLILREILEIGDFDGDGLPDALVSLDTGGNCCPPDFAIVSFRGDGFLATLGPPESMGWGGIDVVMDSDGFLIRSHHWSAGFGNIEDAEWQVDYRIRDGRITEVARRENHAGLDSEPSLTINDVLEAGETRVTFDLNGDGSLDEIVCSFWDRWGLLNCTVNTARQGPVGRLTCSRIGVLPTMQNGWHELACGRRSVAAWSQGEYRMP